MSPRLRLIAFWVWMLASIALFFLPYWWSWFFILGVLFNPFATRNTEMPRDEIARPVQMRKKR